MNLLAWSPYLLIGLGAVAVFCLMPHGAVDRRRDWRAALGSLVGTVVLAGMVVWLMTAALARGIEPGAHPLVGPLFYLFAAIALASAVQVVVHPRPVYSALYLVLTVLAVAGIVLLAGGEFLAIALVLIYAGAILVSVLFVIMLARQAGSDPGVPGEAAGYDLRSRQPLAAVFLSFLLLAGIVAAAMDSANQPVGPPTPMQKLAGPPPGTIARLGAELFGSHILALELAGALLLVAIVGGVAIARRRALAQARREQSAEEDRHG